MIDCQLVDHDDACRKARPLTQDIPGSKPLSRQARHQAKKRAAAGGQVTFIPTDKAVLDAAVAASGISQQAWLREAVDEKIARQETDMSRKSRSSGKSA